MKISLTRKLKHFVEQEVSDGLYEDTSAVVRDALRVLQNKERPVSIDGLFEHRDIEAELQIIMMEVAKEAEADLRSIIAEMRSIMSAKQKMRDLISRVSHDLSNNVAQRESKLPITFSSGGIGSEEAYHNTQIPIPDPNAKGGVNFVQTDLYGAKIDSVEILESIRDDLKGQLDSLSELSEMTSLRLQMYQDRRSKFIQVLSNIMKKISTTQDTLLQNLK